jgi:hypothetical protein
MNPDVRRLLATKREDQIAKVIQELLDGVAITRLKADLEQIDLYTNLLSATERKTDRNWLWPAAIASLCVAIAGILWSVKIPRTQIASGLSTDSLTATVAKTWHIEDAFHARRMHFERLSMIQGPNLGLTIDHGSGDAWFEVEGGDLTLQMLQVSDGALVEIDADKDEVNIYASKGQVTGKVTVTGKVNVTAGPRAGETSVDRRYQIDIPETVDFVADKMQSIPSEFTVHSPSKWALGQLQASSISFTREELRGTGERSLRSGVKSGTIRFDDTAWAVLELREGDLLGLHRTESAAVEVGSENGLIHVTFNGVAAVTVGDLKTSKTLAPSYLEYLYQKKSLALLWGAIVFLWGVIWGVRNSISPP